MSTVLLLLFIFLITNNMFQGIIPGINYFDESLTLFALFLCIFSERVSTHRNADKKRMIFCILVVITIGCISTIYYHIQPNFAGVWRDCFAILKLPLCFYIYSNYTTEQIKEEALKSSAKFSRIFIFILFICAIINLFAPVFNRNGVRYGFQMFGFFYTHNTFLIASVVAMMCILSADGIIKNKKHLIFSIIILILTFRSKAMPIAFLMVLILIIRKRKFQPVEKSKLWLMGIVAAFAAIYISMNRIEEYVNYADSAARGAFYINGIDIANKYFPLGSGFCTFASTLSGKYYSPLYHSYNMSSIWGITKEDTSYAGDTFWPNIYAQYGYIGLTAYIMMLFYLFKSAYGRNIFFSDKWIATIIICIYSLSASTAESFFTNDSAVIFAMILAIYTGKANKRTIKCRKKEDLYKIRYGKNFKSHQKLKHS